VVITVASGKGGTGKTLVATSLAVSLPGPRQAQLLDCDVEEPNAHIFLGPRMDDVQPVYVPTPTVDEARCTLCRKCADVCAYHAIAVIVDKVLVFSELCHGCGACSYFCPEKAISEVGREIGVVETGLAGTIAFVQGRLKIGEPMATPIIRAVKGKMDRSKTVIIDASPGTSCPVVEAVEGSDFCLLVTEPTPFGLSDLTIAVEMVRKLGVPHGVIINRDGSGDEGVERFCASENIPILLRIPFERRIAELYSRGITLAEGLRGWRSAFRHLAEDIESIVPKASLGVDKGRAS